MKTTRVEVGLRPLLIHIQNKTVPAGMKRSVPKRGASLSIAYTDTSTKQPPQKWNMLRRTPHLLRGGAAPLREKVVRGGKTVGFSSTNMQKRPDLASGLFCVCFAPRAIGHAYG